MANRWQLSFKEVPVDALPMPLLLEADPSEANVREYLRGSKGFVAEADNEIVGVCVLAEKGETTLELMNIAVHPSSQGKGVGSELLQFVMKEADRIGAKRLELGTGTFGYQLSFYQKAGFRVTGVIRGFFLDNYDEPIFENGIQHKDMLRLAVEL